MNLDSREKKYLFRIRRLIYFLHKVWHLVMLVSFVRMHLHKYLDSMNSIFPPFHNTTSTVGSEQKGNKCGFFVCAVANYMKHFNIWNEQWFSSSSSSRWNPSFIRRCCVLNHIETKNLGSIYWRYCPTFKIGFKTSVRFASNFSRLLLLVIQFRYNLAKK